MTVIKMTLIKMTVIKMTLTKHNDGHPKIRITMTLMIMTLGRTTNELLYFIEHLELVLLLNVIFQSVVQLNVVAPRKGIPPKLLLNHQTAKKTFNLDKL